MKRTIFVLLTVCVITAAFVTVVLIFNSNASNKPLITSLSETQQLEYLRSVGVVYSDETWCDSAENWNEFALNTIQKIENSPGIFTGTYGRTDLCDVGKQVAYAVYKYYGVEDAFYAPQNNNGALVKEATIQTDKPLLSTLTLEECEAFMKEHGIDMTSDSDALRAFTTDFAIKYLEHDPDARFFGHSEFIERGEKVRTILNEYYK